MATAQGKWSERVRLTPSSWCYQSLAWRCLKQMIPHPISSSNPTITPKSRTFVNSCFSPWFHSFIYTLPCPVHLVSVFFVVVLLLLLHCPSESGEGVFSPKLLIALDWPRARTFLPLPDADRPSDHHMKGHHPPSSSTSTGTITYIERLRRRAVFVGSISFKSVV